jgi:hypothetical protein
MAPRLKGIATTAGLKLFAGAAYLCVSNDRTWASSSAALASCFAALIIAA